MTTVTLQYADNAITTLAAGITSASPSLQVLSGGGALFPAIGTSGQFAFYATLIKNGSPNIYEVVLVEGRSGDNFTSLVRNALGNTPALSWNAGDTIAHLPTAGDLQYFTQVPQAQAQAYSYALDTGAANAYVVNLTPALNGHVVGMPIRWMAGHTNTSSICTFSDGIGQAPMVTPQGNGIPVGSITTGGIYETIWDGTRFQITTIRSVFFAELPGTVVNSQVPQSAVTQYQAALAIAFSQLTGQLQNGQVASSITLPGAPTIGSTPAVGDSSGKVADTAFVNPGSSLVATGYRKNPDGSIEQWGSYTSLAASSNPITFPFSFPTACFNIQLTQANSNATNGYVSRVDPATVTASGFTQVTDNWSTTPNPTVTRYWRAVGK